MGAGEATDEDEETTTDCSFHPWAVPGPSFSFLGCGRRPVPVNARFLEAGEDSSGDEGSSAEDAAVAVLSSGVADSAWETSRMTASCRGCGNTTRSKERRDNTRFSSRFCRTRFEVMPGQYNRVRRR